MFFQKTLSMVLAATFEACTCSFKSMTPKILTKFHPISGLKFTDFSKATGDYPSLSATDIKVMALTYQLETEKVGKDHLPQVPAVKRVTELTSHNINDTKIPGFVLPKNEPLNESSEETLIEENQTHKCNVLTDGTGEKSLVINEDVDDCEDEEEGEPDDDVDEEVSKIQIAIEKLITDQERAYLHEEEFANENTGMYEDELSDSEENTWITPTNICKIKQEYQGVTEDKSVVVACITTDFAMQNVLKHMGLNVISIDGCLINQLRTFILRCYGCFKTTSIMTKVFCPHCGNKTLKKVAVTVNEDGTQKIHINIRRPLSGKGKRFSLPRPRGGKHSNNPILCEDQRVPHQQPSRLSKTKNCPLEPDYIAGYSPFVMRDVTSRSAMLGIHSTNLKNAFRNPNTRPKKIKKK